MTTGAKLASTLVVIVASASLVAISFSIYWIGSFIAGDKLAREGYEALFIGEHDVAIKKLTESLQKSLPKHERTTVYLNRGIAYNLKWRFDEAIHDHTEAIRLDPMLVEAYANRGYSYQRKGEMEKAIGDLTEAIRLDPNSQSAYYNRGLIRLYSGEHDRALEDFEEAIRCRPNGAEALVMRGICYVAKNDVERALASFDGAVAVDPTNPIGYMERSNLYSKQGNYEKRDQDYQQAIRLNPNIGKASTDFAASLLAKQWSGWSAEYSVRTRGKDPHELYSEARAAYALGNYDRGITLANDALMMNMSAKQASAVTMDRGNAYLAKGDRDKALRDYDQAIKLDPRNAGAYVNRARVFSDKADHATALRDLDEAIRINPMQWEAYFNRSADFSEEGRLDEAIADLTKTAELNPSFADAYLNRAAILFKKGEIDGVINDYAKAIELDANSTVAYIGRAKARVRKQEHAEAARDLEDAMCIATKNPEALNSIAWFEATCPEATLRNGQKAVEAAREACAQTDWKRWDYIDTLAAAFAESGDFDQAIKYQRHALQLARERNARTEKGEQRLKLYQQRKPYRE